MTKKDYQAIARALYSVAHGRTQGQMILWHEVRTAIADVLAADNPRFHRDTFLLACADGNVTRQASTVKRRADKSEPLPPCVRAMRCYCAGHARGLSASEPCDTRE
jgi:hypothetical protein